MVSLTASNSPPETNAAMAVAIEIPIEAATADALDHLVIESQEHHDETLKSILIRRAETTELENEKIDILDVTHGMIEHGIETGVVEAIMVTEE